jgi:hypothetical protein
VSGQLHAPAALPRYRLDRRLCWPQIRSESCEDEKKSCPYRDSKSGRPAPHTNPFLFSADIFLSHSRPDFKENWQQCSAPPVLSSALRLRIFKTTDTHTHTHTVVISGFPRLGTLWDLHRNENKTKWTRASTSYSHTESFVRIILSCC